MTWFACDEEFITALNEVKAGGWFKRRGPPPPPRLPVPSAPLQRCYRRLKLPAAALSSRGVTAGGHDHVLLSTDWGVSWNLEKMFPGIGRQSLFESMQALGGAASGQTHKGQSASPLPSPPHLLMPPPPLMPAFRRCSLCHYRALPMQSKTRAGPHRDVL